MEKIKLWIVDNIFKEPLFWTALTLGLTTKAKEFGIAENSPWLQLLQVILGAAAASFVGAKINHNTTLTKENTAITKETKAVAEDTKSIAVNTIVMTNDAKVAAEQAKDTAVETKTDLAKKIEEIKP